MINLAPPYLSCVCKCEECKEKHDGVINTVNVLTADVKELISNSSVIQSKRILVSFTPLDIKDGEEVRISPSLANTGNKTSNVIEPADCPAKFDNPEDVFARELQRQFDELQSDLADFGARLMRAQLLPDENCQIWLFLCGMRKLQKEVHDLHWELAAIRVRMLQEIRWLRRELLLPVEDWSAKGFLEKAGDKGKIVKCCLQELVLSHPSIAFFLTHGWNSSMEAISSGIPNVAFPQWGDQVTNAKYLVDVFKMAIRLSGGVIESNIITREDIENYLSKAISNDSMVTEMKENALNWKKKAKEAVAERGSSAINIQEFVAKVYASLQKEKNIESIGTTTMNSFGNLLQALDSLIQVVWKIIIVEALENRIALKNAQENE
ncbi:putative acyl-coenzyme A thioesterase 9, mitochondrial-like [Capsicum annuum]|nr:putative acyl-coenzyme A thioesterase 9, mitochondrial-like [Capsicum annuum]